jgi:hypothetical protein
VRGALGAALALCTLALSSSCAAPQGAAQRQLCALSMADGEMFSWEDSRREHVYAKRHGFLLALMPYVEATDPALYARAVGLLTDGDQPKLAAIRFAPTRVATALGAYEESLVGGAPDLAALSGLVGATARCAERARSATDRQTCTWALTGMWAGMAYFLADRSDDPFDVEARASRLIATFGDNATAASSTEAAHARAIRQISADWPERARRGVDVRGAILEMIELGVPSSATTN